MDENKATLIGVSWVALLFALLFMFGMTQCRGCEADGGYRSCIKKCVSPAEYCGNTTPGQDPVKCMEACELPKGNEV